MFFHAIVNPEIKYNVLRAGAGALCFDCPLWHCWILDRQGSVPSFIVQERVTSISPKFPVTLLRVQGRTFIVRAQVSFNFMECL